MAQGTTKTRDDVVTLLKEQHKEIRRFFTEIEQAAGEQRRDLFHHLVGLLAVHETAEQEVVHPDVRWMNGGEPIVDARIGEERSAMELLQKLYDMGPESEGFDTLFRQLRDDVLAHCKHEEEDEFPLLHQAHNADQLHTMATWVRAAEAVAPTRPHPGMESPAANILLGPPVAIIDRARDAVREMMKG